MGRIRSLINTTPDGFVDGKYALIDAEFYAFTQGLLEDTQAIAFGRNTFEQFQNRWPLLLQEENLPAWRVRMAKALHDKEKIVYSSTLESTTWNNSAIIPKLEAWEINRYKQQGKGGLLTLGSPELVASLIAMNLVDDFYFCLQPLLAGNGDARLFDKFQLDFFHPLTYVETTPLPSGVQIIHYQTVQ